MGSDQPEHNCELEIPGRLLRSGAGGLALLLVGWARRSAGTIEAVMPC